MCGAAGKYIINVKYPEVQSYIDQTKSCSNAPIYYALKGLCPPPGMCKNTLGGFRCVCPRGYTLDNSGTFCVDRNECSGESSRKQNRCGSNALCKNSPGSYRYIRNFIRLGARY